MIRADAELYEAQGRFEQMRAHIDSGRSDDAMKEAEEGIIAIGTILDGVGYIPSDTIGSGLYDKLYEAQSGLDQVRAYLMASKTEKARIEAEEWIKDIADVLDAIDYHPPSIPGVF